MFNPILHTCFWHSRFTRFIRNCSSSIQFSFDFTFARYVSKQSIGFKYVMVPKPYNSTSPPDFKTGHGSFARHLYFLNNTYSTESKILLNLTLIFMDRTKF
jgi:hypothetical protein